MTTRGAARGMPGHFLGQQSSDDYDREEAAQEVRAANDGQELANQIPGVEIICD